MRIVKTDNFDRDCGFDEEFVNVPSIHEVEADRIADLLNQIFSGDYAPFYYRVVPDDYELKTFVGY